jgi:hypothetical protein
MLAHTSWTCAEVEANPHIFGKLKKVNSNPHNSFNILLGLAWKGQKAACGFDSQYKAGQVKPGCPAYDRTHVHGDK